MLGFSAGVPRNLWVSWAPVRCSAKVFKNSGQNRWKTLR